MQSTASIVQSNFASFSHTYFVTYTKCLYPSGLQIKVVDKFGLTLCGELTMYSLANLRPCRHTSSRNQADQLKSGLSNFIQLSYITCFCLHFASEPYPVCKVERESLPNDVCKQLNKHLIDSSKSSLALPSYRPNSIVTVLYL